MSKVKAIAATIVLALCASVSYAQEQQSSPVFPSSKSPGNVPGGPFTTPLSDGGAFYVACWAEVPSRNTAYFSATFQAPAVSTARKAFRKLVTTQYGPVSNLGCAGKYSQAVVNEQVEKWKDSARSTKNAIVDTYWTPAVPVSPILPGAQAKN